MLGGNNWKACCWWGWVLKIDMKGLLLGFFIFFPSFLIKKRRKQLRAAMRVPHGLEEEQGSEDSTEHPVSPAGMLQSREHGHGSASQAKSSPETEWETILRQGGREEMEQGCRCCPCHSQCMATHRHRDGSGVCCCSVRLQHCAGLQPGPATAEAGTCTQTWHHSWPLSTQDWPHRKSLDRVA